MIGYRQRLLLALIFLCGSAGLPSTGAAQVPGPKPVFAKARLTVSASIGNAFFLHVWTALSFSGGLCRFDTIDRDANGQRPTSWPTSGGGGCSRKPAPRLTKPPAFRYVSIGWEPLTRDRVKANWVPPRVEGELVTGVTPARIVARWPGGSLDLTLRGHYFAGGSPAMYGETYALTLTAYDAAGHVLAFFDNSH